MSKFKIGEEIIKVTGNGLYTNVGQSYIVDGFDCCPVCGDPCLYLKGMNQIVNLSCGSPCTHIWKNHRLMANPENYRKPVSLSSCIEYKLNVSIPELTEIKIEQLI